MEIKVNLSLKQIYEVCCKKCQERVLELASQQADKGALKDILKQQLDTKDGK